MKTSIDQLLAKADTFESAALDLTKLAKIDPKAEVRNRGKVVFPAESSSVKDKKDHFPINEANQARNALAQVGKYTAAPSWYKGSLESLISAVRRAVKKHYPSIEESESKPSKKH